MPRLVIIDDHPLMRAGLVDTLAAQPGFHVVGEHSSAESALVALPRQRPDVVIVDHLLGGMDGIDAISHLRNADPVCCALMLTSYASERTALAAFAAGARGFIVKGSEPAVLLDAVRHAVAGDLFIDPSVVRRLVLQALAGRRVRGPRGLTVQERRVIDRAAETTGQAAVQLGLAATTVKGHRSRALGKVAVLERAAAPDGRVHETGDRVLIVADPRAREGVAAVIGSTGGLSIAGAVGSLADALHIGAAGDPDVVIMDLELPAGAASSAVLTVVESFPRSRVVALSERTTSHSLLTAFGAGAHAIVRKESEGSILHQALRAVTRGHMFVDPSMAGTLLRLAGPSVRAGDVNGLTLQQVRVLELLGSGLTNKQIAEALGIRESTAKTHVREVLRKLGVHKRAEVARVVAERRLL